MNQDKGTHSQPSSSLQATLQASRFLIYIVFIILAIIGYLIFSRPQPDFFVDAPNGAVSEIFPLTEPNVTPSSLVKWATQAATSAYTIDFFNYQDNIDALREYFTVDGYQQFLAALDAGGVLDRIKADKLIVSAVATNTGVILSEGELRGAYTWRIQVPLLLTYQGASTTSTQKNIAVTMLVTRVSTDEAPKGIGIAQLVDSEIYEAR